MAEKGQPTFPVPFRTMASVLESRGLRERLSGDITSISFTASAAALDFSRVTISDRNPTI